MIKKIKKGKKIKLSKNFWSDEWDCHCSHRDCTHTFISTDLVKELQKKRSEWKRAIVLSSGYRCPYWNKKKGGARKSQHLLGTAADIAVAGKSPSWVADNCEDFNGLGRYPKHGFTHVDVRGGKKQRWKER